MEILKIFDQLWIEADLKVYKGIEAILLGEFYPLNLGEKSYFYLSLGLNASCKFA